MPHRVPTVVGMTKTPHLLGAGLVSLGLAAALAATLTAGPAQAEQTAARPAGTQAATVASVTPDSKAPRCRSAQLKITLGAVDAGAGNRYLPVRFTNRSKKACTLRGYPTVEGLNAKGHAVTTARHAQGPRVVTVTLQPGQRVTATVHATAVPSGNATSCGPDYAGLRVTAPGGIRSAKVKVELPSCSGLSVTPIG
jgi:hypothetical protein